MITTPTQPSSRVAALLKKTQAKRGRLVFAIDASASRENTWDISAKLTSEMSEEAARIGGLDIQLVYFRGYDEVQHSSWFSDVSELISLMSTIRCRAGATQLRRVLQHIRAEHERGKVSAAVFTGDACEEAPNLLYDAAAGLGVPVFMFEEGNGPALHPSHRTGEFIADDPPLTVEQVFREIARLSGGAFGRFDAGSAKQLRELLNAIAAFAVGGMTALASQNTDSARKLLGQMK